MMGSLLRSATVKDIDTLICFMRQYYRFDHLPFNEAKARKAMMSLLKNRNFGRVWLITINKSSSKDERHDISIGYIVLTLGYSLEFLGKDAFIDELFIVPSYRRRGVGESILEASERYARKIGVRAILLEVTRHNKNALRFYKKVGFQDHHRYLVSKEIA